MNIETERKFLVLDDGYKAQAVKSYRIRQGYLAHDSGRSVRVRIRDDKGFLTVKGPAIIPGSRPEWEKEISLQEAEDLFLLCKPGSVDKVRWIVPAQMPGQAGHDGGSTGSPTVMAGSPTVMAGSPTVMTGSPAVMTGSPTVMAGSDRPSRFFEVDEFRGENEGLVLAEIELGSPDEPFARPSWLGEEVTDDKRYYNGYLARNPFKTW